MFFSFLCGQICYRIWYMSNNLVKTDEKRKLYKIEFFIFIKSK